MSELLPCPFCGGEAHTYKTIAERYCAICNKPFCASVGPFDTEAEAIAAWNTRVERTCHIESTNGEWHCSCCGEVVGSDDPWCELFTDENAIRLWNYCPKCGAKVVGE